MTQQLSNCCKAEVTVSSSDEGTSCFVCCECERPCDLHHDMKEQVSAYYQCPCCAGINTTPPVLQLISACRDCEEQIIIWDKEENVSSSEYERLKRMDDNVKRELKKLEDVKKLYDDQELDSSCPLARNINSKLDFLKGLYDERK